MGTIADKLERVLKTKKDIQSALVKNGKYVPDKLPFKYYPDLIDNMNIDGLVGMYYGKGLTNEELSKDPTWYDTSGNGNDLKFKNFAWKLNSGVGVYKEDFTSNSWIKPTDRVDITATNSSVLISSIKSKSIQFLKYRADSLIAPSMIVKIIGLPAGISLEYRTSKTIMLSISSDGVYTLPNHTMEEGDQYCGFKFLKTVDSCNITIEQIPDYAGAVCFDGIDDCAVCDTFPILTKEKGYTVMVLRKWINRKNAYDGLISNKNVWSNGCAFIVEYSDGIKDGTISFGRNTYVDYSQDFLVYQTSQNYNGNQILTGDYTEGTAVLNLGRLASSGFSQYSNYAIYALCIIDHDTSDAEREIVINKWKQYYPELLS